MHSILRQQEAQFVAVGGCGCLSHDKARIKRARKVTKPPVDIPLTLTRTTLT